MRPNRNKPNARVAADFEYFHCGNGALRAQSKKTRPKPAIWLPFRLRLRDIYDRLAYGGTAHKPSRVQIVSHVWRKMSAGCCRSSDGAETNAVQRNEVGVDADGGFTQYAPVFRAQSRSWRLLAACRT